MIDSGWIGGEFSCDDPDDACHQDCPKLCTRWDPKRGPGGSWYHEVEDDDPHWLVSTGVCLAIEWIENTGCAEDAYGGSEMPLRDGVVEIRWEDGGPTWIYPEVL
jgi:hypothetical protein